MTSAPGGSRGAGGSGRLQVSVGCLAKHPGTGARALGRCDICGAETCACAWRRLPLPPLPPLPPLHEVMGLEVFCFISARLLVSPHLSEHGRQFLGPALLCALEVGWDSKEKSLVLNGGGGERKHTMAHGAPLGSSPATSGCRRSLAQFLSPSSKGQAFFLALPFPSFPLYPPLGHC